MTNFFFKFKKPYFWPFLAHFPNFWGKGFSTQSSCYALLKGNRNFQGMLNWIIQMLHYHFRKQHKNIEISRTIEENGAISLCSSLCLLRLALPSPPSTQGIFSSWTQWSFVLYIVSFSALKLALCKLSLAKFRYLHKKPYIFHVFNYYRTFLQISLF